MKKWAEESNDFLEALGGPTINPLVTPKNKKEKTQTKDEVPSPAAVLPKKVTSINVDPELYRKFKSFSAEKGSNISALLCAAMEDMLEGSYYPKKLK